MQELKDEIIALLPSLRGFARSLARNDTEAEDLMQETLVKAIGNIHQFTPGTNLRAWLFTIQRNTFYTSYHRRRREQPVDSDAIDGISTQPGQEWALKLKRVHEALYQLPAEQREALMLIGGAGLTYEEAAEICDCALGTIKSRVNRARCRLLELLEEPTGEDYLDRAHHSAIANPTPRR
jgi:RNA polymerase sigma-70 factor, ECF subfamily